jgi:hypothetical protein
MNPDQQPPHDDNSIFMTKVAPSPTPEDKKNLTLILTVGLIIGFAVLVVSIFLLLFLGANNAATDYKKNSVANITTLTSKIQSIDIDAVLNQRDISGSIAEVEKLQRDRPRLASVLFGDSFSASYQDAEAQQKQNDAYYVKVTTFANDLPGLLNFAQATDETQSDLLEMTKTPIQQSPQAQTMAGSVDTLAAQVKDLTVPVSLVESRDLLAKAYAELAEGYRDLADALIDPDQSQAQARRRIADALRSIDSHSDSSTFAQKVKEYVAQLVDESKALIRQ